jgi:hypothetical protein
MPVSSPLDLPSPDTLATAVQARSPNCFWPHSPLCLGAPTDATTPACGYTAKSGGRRWQAGASGRVPWPVAPLRRWTRRCAAVGGLPRATAAGSRPRGGSVTWWSREVPASHLEGSPLAPISRRPAPRASIHCAQPWTSSGSAISQRKARSLQAGSNTSDPDAPQLPPAPAQRRPLHGVERAADIGQGRASTWRGYRWSATTRGRLQDGSGPRTTSCIDRPCGRRQRLRRKPQRCTANATSRHSSNHAVSCRVAAGCHEPSGARSEPPR